MIGLVSVFLGCGSSTDILREPTFIPLKHNVTVPLPALGAELRAHGWIRFDSSHIGFPPSKISLVFFREGEMSVVFVEQDRAAEIWGHSFVVLGHEMDTLWICPPGWSAGSEGCVEPAGLE